MMSVLGSINKRIKRQLDRQRIDREREKISMKDRGTEKQDIKAATDRDTNQKG